MRNPNQIAGKPRLKGGDEAGTPDHKSPPTSRPKPCSVTPAYGSCAHSAPAGGVDGRPDRSAKSSCAESAVCRSVGYWRAVGRAST